MSPSILNTEMFGRRVSVYTNSGVDDKDKSRSYASRFIQIENQPTNWLEDNEIEILTVSYEPDYKEVASIILSTFKFIEPVDTSAWKTYRNEQYGFEIKYPSDRIVALRTQDVLSDLTTDKAVEIQFPKRGESAFGFYVMVHEISTNQTLRQYLAARDGASQTAYESYPSKNVLESRDVVIAGLSAIQRREDLVAAAFTRFVTYLQKGQLVYEFELFPAPADSRYTASDEATHHQILSTFKFIESVDTSNWKTYRNEEYGFELSYPTNWKLIEYSPESIILDLPNNPGIAKTYFGLSIENKTLGTIRGAMPQEITREDVVVAGRASDKYIYSSSHVSVYIPFDDRAGVYGIDLYTPPGIDEPNQIFSTLRFIEPR